MAFHLKPRQPCITKHARDWTSDDMPSDDVDVVSRQGVHFGFPYWRPGDFPDPQYGKNRSCTDFTKLKRSLGANVASPGMRLHTDKMFPASFTNNIFIARNGPRSHTVKQGYNLARVTVDGKGNAKSESFPEGLMIDEKANPPMCCRWPMVLCWCRATITASSTA